MMKRSLVVVLLACMVIISGCTKKFALDQEYYNTSEDFVYITSDAFENLDFQNYVLFVSTRSCAFSVPCDEIFQQYMKQKHISFLSMSYDEFKNTKLHEQVRFAPSVIIVKNWKIVAYLDPEKDKYLDMYQDVEKFGAWFEKYVDVEAY